MHLHDAVVKHEDYVTIIEQLLFATIPELLITITCLNQRKTNLTVSFNCNEMKY